jgi:5-methylcytosine-specific restriction endonuclease McrA
MGTLKHIRRTKMIAQGGRCYYCGLPIWDEAVGAESGASAAEKLAPKSLRCTAEHLHARSEGGGNQAHNIVAACWYCNTRRHRAKRPLAPEAYRLLVQQRMAAGKWLSALNP